MNSTRRIGWEIAAILLLKLLLLFALWALFFSPTHRIRIAPDTVDAHLLSAP